MGLDTTHGCYHGSYGSFNTWRRKVCEVSGLGQLDHKVGFGGQEEWPDVENDPLVILLSHSDCEGSIPWESCLELAECLKELMPAMRRADNRENITFYEQRTSDFIGGLHLAYSQQENVEFH